MTFCFLVKKIYERLYVHLWAYRKYSSIYYCHKTKKTIGKRNIWLLGVPRSTNLGDHAQVLCSEKWFRENYPGYIIHEFDSFEIMNHDYLLLDFIATHIQNQDIVFFQSGYNFTDMYPVQEVMHRETVKRISNNKIVFLPQTIKFERPFETNEFIKKSSFLYSNNPNVFLLCRDKKSLEIASEALPNVKKCAFPDIVTTMIGNVELQNVIRTKAMLCVRHDKEGALKETDIRKLTEELKKIGKVIVTDTTLKSPSFLIVRNNRSKYIYKMLNEMRSCKVVVTDRYHGLVFSMITNTPVVLLKTIDHKIIEGVKWFPAEMICHIKIADNIESAILLAGQLANEPEYKLNDYFQKKYYANLKKYLDDDSYWS